MGRRPAAQRRPAVRQDLAAKVARLVPAAPPLAGLPVLRADLPVLRADLPVLRADLPVPRAALPVLRVARAVTAARAALPRSKLRQAFLPIGQPADMSVPRSLLRGIFHVCSRRRQRWTSGAISNFRQSY